MINKNDVMSMMDCSIDSNFNFTINGQNPSAWTDGNYTNLDYEPSINSITVWDYWQNYYYPYVIRESYPVYITERAKDKGKQAFEIIKILKDKKLVKLEKVSDFIDLMDELIKIL